MVFKMKGWNGWSPLKHGKNPEGDKPHAKFKTETEHEEYHDIYPTKDLNEAELKELKKQAEKETSPLKHPIEEEHSHTDGKVIITPPPSPPDKVSLDKPKVVFGEFENRPGVLGRYIPETNTIKLNSKYKKSVSEIMKMGPERAKEMLIERGETYRHEDKHHDQFIEHGISKYDEISRGEHMGQLEGHMDPFVHGPEHRQKEDWEVHPEVKTAKKYESINPALEEITADRYTDWWRKRGQYITPGTLEYEAEEAAYKKNKNTNDK